MSMIQLPEPYEYEDGDLKEMLDMIQKVANAKTNGEAFAAAVLFRFNVRQHMLDQVRARLDQAASPGVQGPSIFQGKPLEVGDCLTHPQPKIDPLNTAIGTKIVSNYPNDTRVHVPVVGPWAQKFQWPGPGPEPASWFTPDGVKVYRSYGDFIDD